VLLTKTIRDIYIDQLNSSILSLKEHVMSDHTPTIITETERTKISPNESPSKL
jgi:hypothetical protein